MLIGIDASRAFGRNRTGTENYSLYLVRALAELAGAHRLRLYVSQTPPCGLLPHYDHVEYRVMAWRRLWTHTRLAWELVQHPPDVLFVPAHVLPIIHPSRSVVTIHDLGYIHYPDMHTAMARRYLDWSTRHNARGARRIVADSRATRDDLVACYHVDSAKIDVVYPAGAGQLEPVRDPERLQAARAKYGLSSSYYIHVGTLHPRKNLVGLLDAFTSLVSRSAVPGDTQLVLVGREGWLYDDIVARAAAPELRGRVILTGYAPEEDLAALLSGAIAYVLPSWYEGFGLPALEAMACETPVVCSNVSSLPEVVGDAALLVDPADTAGIADAMARVCQDRVLAEDLVRRGTAQVRHFGWNRTARQVLDILEDVGGLTP